MNSCFGLRGTPKGAKTLFDKKEPLEAIGVGVANSKEVTMKNFILIFESGIIEIAEVYNKVPFLDGPRHQHVLLDWLQKSAQADQVVLDLELPLSSGYVFKVDTTRMKVDDRRILIVPSVAIENS